MITSTIILIVGELQFIRKC